ncbi:hypothetical protein M378DRAFT_914165 [Amanita muscaria Koide BX008]|uniref:Uncharacterized protein n=1 Tax=Amanita muscaria (strain Koide BX008) TaxID=946122 RepID=A0A0C2WGM3_AMAMK|nr:hypothetical protein M378DRAFT_914165 [Amanita muscaria Koide BX008]
MPLRSVYAPTLLCKSCETGRHLLIFISWKHRGALDQTSSFCFQAVATDKHYQITGFHQCASAYGIKNNLPANHIFRSLRTCI